ncbi:hypothetical protein [Bacillus sp. FJAT-45066]|uniref:hypothetical protein n=1 Tax=Bacillus sp. FJAT-45066 TaxID=2011010 RepID=UPI000BB90870|nr:hypothetical protein [Bacillus sp. FJAT-45066]
MKGTIGRVEEESAVHRRNEPHFEQEKEKKVPFTEGMNRSLNRRKNKKWGSRAMKGTFSRVKEKWS